MNPQAFYSFSRPPFERDLPPESRFRCAMLDEAHARLLWLLETCCSGILVGEHGTGKSTALRRLRDGVHPERVRPIYLHDSPSTTRVTMAGCSGWRSSDRVSGPSREHVAMGRGLGTKSASRVTMTGQVVTTSILSTRSPAQRPPSRRGHCAHSRPFQAPQGGHSRLSPRRKCPYQADRRSRKHYST